MTRKKVSKLDMRIEKAATRRCKHFGVFWLCAACIKRAIKAERKRAIWEAATRAVFFLAGEGANSACEVAVRCEKEILSMLKENQ